MLCTTMKEFTEQRQIVPVQRIHETIYRHTARCSNLFGASRLFCRKLFVFAFALTHPEPKQNYRYKQEQHADYSTWRSIF